MKSTMLLLSLIVSTSVFAQTAKDAATQSKLEVFALKTGSLFKREFKDIGTIRRIDIKAITFTDVIQQTSLKGVKLGMPISKSYGTTSVSSILDQDEIEAFVKSSRLLLDMPTEGTNNYIEYNFISRGGFQSGSYNDKKDGWKYFLQLDRYDKDSYAFLDKEDFKKLVDLVESCK
ncbi:MAG: hypothetical protein QM731_13310 [Chitinophagaceae bacterium]